MERNLIVEEQRQSPHWLVVHFIITGNLVIKLKQTIVLQISET